MWKHYPFFVAKKKIKMSLKKTLVIGASTNPERYSFKAINSLRNNNYEVVAYGNKSGLVLDVPIQTIWDTAWNIDTVTLYVGALNQTEDLMDKIIALNPARVIFNPGTENPRFFTKLQEANVMYELACTLVLLSTGMY